MKIFFDTEFTGLHKNTTLISIGLVDENDRTFYGEFSDYDKSQCDEWIKENVISNLKWSKDGPIEEFTNMNENNWEAYGDKEYIKLVLIDWLSKYEEVQLVSDCSHYDMVLFIDIFGDAFYIPDNVNPVCHDINQDITNAYRKDGVNMTDKLAFDISREAILKHNNIKIKGNKHNSLYDAKVIKELYYIFNYD